MNFVIDAQLPRRLALHLRSAGHDAIHTLDLPGGNRTTDREILALADREDRVVVTKDADFVTSFVVAQQPRRLLLISTGNITNAALEALILPNLPAIIHALRTHDFVEVTRTVLVIHV